jgi:cobalt/nickel transport system permease protein
MMIQSLTVGNIPFLGNFGWYPIFAMHIPDGFLSLPVMVVTWAIAIGLITLALRQVQAEYQERAVPLMGVCAAFILPLK